MIITRRRIVKTLIAASLLLLLTILTIEWLATSISAGFLPQLAVHLKVDTKSLSNNDNDKDIPVEVIVGEQIGICSDIDSNNDNTSLWYKQLIDNLLKAWHTFIPHYDNMSSSNCWYAQNFLPLPPEALEKLKRWFVFTNIASLYTIDEAKDVIKLLLGKDNVTKFGTNASSLSSSQNFFCLPRVFLAGFPKAGTSTLHSMIVAHPQIAKPRFKEIQFWRDYPSLSAVPYRQLDVLHYLFAFKTDLSAKNVVIDSSVTTVFSTVRNKIDIEKNMCVVPTLLRRALPNSKLIFVMREPVARLWSDYWFLCSRQNWVKENLVYKVPNQVLNHAPEIFHNLTIQVMQKFHKCLESGRSEFECTAHANSDYFTSNACENPRIGISLYYFHVVKWLSLFPRNQILFLRLEDFTTDPSAVMQSVWKFLGVSSLTDETLDVVKRNENTWIVSKQYHENFKMWPRTQKLLADFFRPYNERLSVLLNDSSFLWK